MMRGGRVTEPLWKTCTSKVPTIRCDSLRQTVRGRVDVAKEHDPEVRIRLTDPGRRSGRADPCRFAENPSGRTV